MPFSPLPSLAGHRVLLIHPGIYDGEQPYAFPPWGALVLASACRARGAQVHVADLNGRDPAQAAAACVRDFAPTVVGVTAKLGKGAERMVRVLGAVRSERPGAAVAVGGPLVALYPDRALELWRGADALFWGDGEDTFPEWIAAGCPPVDRPAPAQARDLDAVGVPWWWEGLRHYVWPAEHWPGMDVPSLHVSAARGCTRRCTFCYLNTQYPGRSFRFVGARRLLADCDALNRSLGVEGFYFVDDCFLDAPPVRAREFLGLLQARGAPYRFGCDIQIQELEDTALLERMYAGGFRSLYLGIEAASPAVRRRLGKGRIGSPVDQVVNRALDMGFVIRASIGIGWPGEDEGEMQQTLEMIGRIPRLAFDAYRYTPLPNVPLTSFWRRGGGRAADGGAAAAFDDYSEFSRNHSGLDDERFDRLWAEMRRLEAERLDRYWPSVPAGAAAAASG